MAITPIEFPSPLKFRTVSFEPMVFQLDGVDSYGGAGQQIEYADPIWVAQYETPPLTARNKGLYQGFLNKLHGRIFPIYMWDVSREVPLFYEGQGGSPWGTPEYAAHSRSASTFDLTDWTASATLYAGDYFSLQDTTGRWFLFRLTADAIASGAGAVTVNVYPRPPRNTTFTVGQVLRVRKAACLGVLRWNPNDFKESVGSNTPFNFNAHQITRLYV